MEWTLTQARRFAAIDRELAPSTLAPAEYEVVRRVIAATGDLNFADCLRFSNRALALGAAALASRRPILTDSSMVQAGISPLLAQTFANPVYCAMDVGLRSPTDPSQIAEGIQQLVRQMPDAIVAIGQSSLALALLGQAIAQQIARPALLVATPVPWLAEEGNLLQHLAQTDIPQITLGNRLGGAEVAVAIVSAAIDLAWQAYHQTLTPTPPEKG